MKQVEDSGLLFRERDVDSLHDAPNDRTQQGLWITNIVLMRLTCSQKTTVGRSRIPERVE